MKSLTTAIFGKMASTTDLYADIGGRLYKGQAPAGAQYPYVVFMVVSDVPERTFTEVYENVLIQFSLFSSALGSGEVENMFTHLKSLYDECAMTITAVSPDAAATLIWMRRQNATLMVEDHTTPDGTQQVWAYHVDFEVLTSLN